MKVLVTGAAGQLGHEVCACFGCVGAEVVALTRADLDVASRQQVLGALSVIGPDVVVNCAAYTAVDQCEAESDRAYLINALAVRYLAEAANRFDVHLCHISTDYVFSGSKGEPYHEWDQPAPLSVYGASKLAGEQEAGPKATVVRTSWLCGVNGNNVVKTVLELARRGDPLKFVTDQRGSPSFASDVAKIVQTLCSDRRPGVYHVANEGEATWYEFAKEVLLAAGHDPDLVEPITTSELSSLRPARRPANSVLDNRALRLAGITQLPHYSESLVRLVKALGV
ncbi:MAG: dTDP-4-dehydrorhamnose reductase [Acidimicrobiia bacterium]|nr:dTDP-4-dehydrorhamnose reductase [Acidimicrobiia bacterium]MYC57338.1 dTDP-4-dehydrorhamnose reductase [Acidimicrobiia bacterium]MYG94541.1 dTDP-4-dehydrorhamnose reductase [Acidimicrobiia bacterium]MYI30280.1 dTDP-4-dehydrorhamnose reductase [Acidimicrobiia bacterium]